MKTKEEIIEIIDGSQALIDNLIELIESEKGENFDIERFKKISDDIVSLNSSVSILRWVLD